MQHYETLLLTLSTMLIKEYRIIMPLTVDEYQVGQLFALAEASLLETGGGEGVEIVRNEPFENIPLLNGQYTAGQYSYKKYYLASKVPAFIRFLVPNQSMVIHEESWNAYPYCKTIVTNPGYMKDNFVIEINTLHLPGRGTEFNVHELPAEKLRLREVIYIDIANDPVSTTDYKAKEDPSKFKSVKTGRGNLKGNWKENVEPVMTCFKLVTVEFKWFGMQNRVENFVQKSERRLFTTFNRQVFCWIDKWYNLTLEDVRAIEERVRDELDAQREDGDVRGMRAA